MSTSYVRFVLDRLHPAAHGDHDAAPDRLRIERPATATDRGGTSTAPDMVTTAVQGRPDSRLDDVFGRAMRFGPPDRLDVTTTTALEDADWSAGFTVAGWIRPRAGEPPSPVVLLGRDEPGAWLALCAGEHLEVRWPHDDGWATHRVPGDLEPDQWVHVTLVHASDRLAVHVDGSPRFDQQVPAIDLGIDPPLSIGGATTYTPRLGLPPGGRGHALTKDGTIYAAVVEAQPDTTPPVALHVGLWDTRTGASVLDDDGEPVRVPLDDPGPWNEWFVVFSGPNSEILLTYANGSLSGLDRRTWTTFDHPVERPEELLVSSDGRLVMLRFSRNIAILDGLTLEGADQPAGYREFLHDYAHMSDDMQSLRRVAFSDDASTYLSVKKHVYVFGASSEAVPLNHDLGYGRPVQAMALSGDGRTAAVAWDELGAHVYDTSTGSDLAWSLHGFLQRADGSTREVHDLAFVPGVDDLLALEQGRLTRTSFVPGDRLVPTSPTSFSVEVNEGSRRIQVLPHAGWIVLHREDGSLHLLHLDTGKEVVGGLRLTPDDFEGDGSTVVLFDVPGSGEIAVGSDVSPIGLYDPRTIAGHGFVGDIAQVTLRDVPREPDDVVADLKASLPEVRVGTIFPIDFSLHDGNQQQALYLQELPQQLRIDVRNVSDRALRIPAGSPHAGSGTFEVWLRPGTLAPGLDRTTVTLLDTPGWATTWQPGPHETDGTDVFVLHRVADSTVTTDGQTAGPEGHAGGALGVGETLGITFDGLELDTTQPARTTRVQLKFRLQHHDGSPLAGSRLHHLRILPESDSKLHQHVDTLDQQLKDSEKRATTLKGRVEVLEQQETLLRTMAKAEETLATHEYFSHGGPLEASVIGVGALRNDGVLENQLTIRVQDHVHGEASRLSQAKDRPPTFRLHLVAPEAPDGVTHDAPNTWLLTAADLASSTLEVQPASLWAADRVQDGWSIGPAHPDDTGQWPAQLSPITMTLTTTCRTTTGRGDLRITYLEVGPDAAKADPGPDDEEYAARPPSPVGLLVVPVDRSPLIAVDQNRTVANGTVDLTGSPRIALRHESDGNPATVAMDLDGDGGLRVQSTGRITLRPSRSATDLAVPSATPAPPPATASTPVLPSDVAVVGSLGVQGDVHAEGHDLVARGAAFAGDIELSPTSEVHRGGVDGGSWLVPAGAIMMWWGPEDPPVGWAICNGDNGTPDMRSRFPVGAFSDSPVRLGTAGPPEHVPLSQHPRDTTGGEEKHRLLDREAPSHDHSWAHTPVPHDHGMTNTIGIATTDEDDDSLSVWAPRNHEIQAKAANIKDKFRHESSGGGQPHENMPPYRALHFIMKLPPTSATPAGSP